MTWRAAWDFARENCDRLRELVGEVRQAIARSDEKPVTWTERDLADCLEVPDPYFLGRGYRAETLVHFGVGRCVRTPPDGNRRVLGWSIIPVRDRQDRPLLGYTARNPQYIEGGTAPK